MVSPLESVGSMVMAPIALVAKLSEMNVQRGVFESALLVLQMPPPAAPTYSLHRRELQLLSMAIAEIRPEAT